MRKNDFDWFPLSSDYPTHERTQRLCDELGDTADAYPVRLMCWLRDQENIDGAFPSEKAVERIARWGGSIGQLVASLRGAGILDGLTYHGWREKGGRSVEKMLNERARKAGTSAEVPRNLQDKRKSKNESKKLEKEPETELPKDSCPEAGSGPPSDVPHELVGLVLYEDDTKLRREWPRLFPALCAGHPGIDVAAEIRRAHAWEVGNPKNAKKDRPRFLTSWMGRAQDRARPAGTADRPPTRGRAEPSSPELFAPPTGDGKPVWKEL